MNLSEFRHQCDFAERRLDVSAGALFARTVAGARQVIAVGRLDYQRVCSLAEAALAGDGVPLDSWWFRNLRAAIAAELDTLSPHEAPHA